MLLLGEVNEPCCADEPTLRHRLSNTAKKDLLDVDPCWRPDTAQRRGQPPRMPLSQCPFSPDPDLPVGTTYLQILRCHPEWKDRMPSSRALVLIIDMPSPN